MEQTHSKKLQLGRLVADALGEIERLGYSRGSRDRYRTTWKQLIEFSQRKELGDEFSADLVARFLEECRVRDQQTNASDGWRRHIAFEVIKLHRLLRSKIVNSMRPGIRVPLLVVFLLAQRLVLLVTFCLSGCFSTPQQIGVVLGGLAHISRPAETTG